MPVSLLLCVYPRNKTREGRLKVARCIALFWSSNVGFLFACLYHRKKTREGRLQVARCFALFFCVRISVSLLCGRGGIVEKRLVNDA